MNYLDRLKTNRPLIVDQFSWISCQLGVFFLPSSVFIAALFLLKACISGSLVSRNPYFKDPWNIPFAFGGFLMIIGCINSYSGWLAWIGLANWIPFFWMFWAIQPYLETSDSRRRIALCMLLGSFPVVITGIGQMFLGWEGPWQLFNGLIVWFIAPGGEPLGRLSGLFDYANIAGAWLALVWPICLASLLERNLTFQNRIILFSFAVAIVSSLILTDSRNAWGGLLLAVPFVMGPSSWIWLLPFLGLLMMPVLFAVLPWFGSDLQQWSRSFVPESLWKRLSDIGYINERTLASTRINQWLIAISLIFERPWFGWGAAAFTVLYPLRTGQWHGHAHNLPLEVSISHGMPVAFLVVLSVLVLLITALKRGVLNPTSSTKNCLNRSTFDRAWWTSAFVLVVLHGADMPFFDSRLNIAGWILLAGVRCLISPTSNLNSLQRLP